jgi:hypothetical protein
MKRKCVLFAAAVVVAIISANQAAAQCDVGYGGCAGGECHGWGDYGCGFDGCGGYALDVCCGRRPGKLKGCKHAMKKACRKARKVCGGGNAYCSDGCFGCGTYGGCDGGCDGSGVGDYQGEVVGDYPVGETVIGEGYSEDIEHSSEVPVDTPGVPMEAPAPMVPPVADGPTTYMPPSRLMVQPASFQPGGMTGLSGGLQFFWASQYEQAIPVFTEAAAADAGGALAHYLLAVSYRRTGQQATAKAALIRALAAEQAAPIADWGLQMRRIQGADRIWLEDARQAAGL